MIRKLKRRIILIAAVSMAVLMTVLVAIMNLVNLTTVIRESDRVLEMISKPGFPIGEEQKDLEPPEGKNDSPEKMKDFVPNGMSVEVPYESRFFSVTVDADGKIDDFDLSQIISVDKNEIPDYVKKATSTERMRGFAGRFRFLKTETNGETQIVFLDCGRRLDSFENFLLTSLVVGLLGCLTVFFAFLFAAGRIVRPIAESYEKQKRFISDAGHEIKTPLTIIGANVDLLECEGQKEELTEIRTQTKRLTALTKDLVYLSKMEEREKAQDKVDCPISDIVSETAASFRAPALAKGMTVVSKVESGLSLCASPDALRQLVSLLVENAVKYSPAGGEITVSLQKAKKTLQLSVKNAVEKALTEEELPRLFDRFYRTDSSRNSELGGHGIGLSIAKAITDAHGGTILASCPAPNLFEIRVSLPI